jgi:tetratricopeptide (TPR) repeat protein
MAALRFRSAFLLPIALVAACTSATDRLNDGIALQAQGRYMEAAYRYADAVDRDAELQEARERLLAVGDSAIMVAMDDADDLERRGDPVSAARLYQSLDQLMGRVRQVGMRLDPPGDYMDIRRAIFDNAIGWQMVRGDEARDDGRWADAQRYYQGARESFLLPARLQIEESLDAETRILLQWADIELTDGRPRAAHTRAQQALEVRTSPPRDVVLEVRGLQDRALEAGSVVVAIPPVTAAPGVREYLGPEFEIALDNDLQLDHWNQPPLFVKVADPLILRTELRGLLRGQAVQSPTIVGRALDLVGADLGVIIALSSIEVREEDVRTDRHRAVIPAVSSNGGVPRRGDAAMDTVTYTTLRGTVSYYLEAEILVVDNRGREVERFTSSSSKTGPFQRGEFDGDPSRLPLTESEEPYFDPRVRAEQLGSIEGALMEDLAVAIAAGTYDTLLRRVL